MSGRRSPLDDLKVAAPCPAEWSEMAGGGRVRFCARCELNVYNLSGMTRAEAERLVTNAEGRLCVRFFRRADGTILTENCPVGLRALKRRVSRAASATLSAALGFLAGLGLTAASGERGGHGLPHYPHTMGAMVAPPPPPDSRPAPPQTPPAGAEEIRGKVSGVYVTGTYAHDDAPLPENRVVPFEQMKMMKKRKR